MPEAKAPRKTTSKVRMDLMRCTNGFAMDDGTEHGRIVATGAVLAANDAAVKAMPDNFQPVTTGDE